jgi:hypothetical protein
VASESQTRRRQRRDVGRLLAAAAALALAVLVGQLPSLTWPAALVVVVVGGVVVVVGLLRRQESRRPAPRRLDPVGAAAWLALVMVALTWEVGTLLQGSTAEHPSLSVLLDPLLDDQVVRSAAFLGWLSLGGYLVRR